MGPSPLSRVRYPQLHGPAPSAVSTVVLDLPLARTRRPAATPLQIARVGAHARAFNAAPPALWNSGAAALRADRLRCLYPLHGDGDGDIGRCARAHDRARLHGWCTAAVRPTRSALRQALRALASAMPCMQVRMHAPRRPNLPGVNLSVQSIRHTGACARALGDAAPSVRARDMQCVGKFLVWFTLIFFGMDKLKTYIRIIHLKYSMFLF
jgi:hypothetical protein